MTSTIAAIHTGFKQLGIAEDDDKRAIYPRVTGKARLSLMKPAEKDAVLQELRRLGLATTAPRLPGRNGASFFRAPTSSPARGSTPRSIRSSAAPASTSAR
jgi:hypothetical protein